MKIKDYVLYDRANNHLTRFGYSGDIVLYGNKDEAIADCYGNEEVIQFENLPNDKQKEIIKQLKLNKLAMKGMKITELIDELEQLKKDGKTHLTLLGNTCNGDNEELDIHFNHLEVWNDGEITGTLFMSNISEEE